MSLTVLVVLAAAASEPSVPVWAYIAGALIPAIGALLGGVKWWTGKIEKRLVSAQGDVQIATANLTEQQADQIQEEIRLSVLESVQTDMARQREETARAQAAEKEAIAEVAILIAQYQRDRAEWKETKHEYENTIRALRLEVDSLREEVHTLRVALGVEQGRRMDDDRFSQLEKRANVSEKRADRAQKRADKAQDVAEEQEHRNDDTPGHA